MKKDKYFIGVDLCDNSNIGMSYDFSSATVMKKSGNVFEVVDNYQKQIKNHNDRVEFDKEVDKMKEKYNIDKLVEV